MNEKITAEDVEGYLYGSGEGPSSNAHRERGIALVRSLERIRVAAENRFQDGVALQQALDAHRKEFGT